jgi:extracellular factor (EF) 3-hydroxypalmitic acid methyl ester biosynthesis protein
VVEIIDYACAKSTQLLHPATTDVQSALDRIATTFEQSNPATFICELTDGLRILKDRTLEPDWYKIVIPAVRSHPLVQWVHQCPLTRYAFEKPRGYSGDAGLLDIIYRHEAAEPFLAGTTSVGRGIFDFTLNVSACEAVRHRRNFIAQKIDEIAISRDEAEILSVASGHLREAEISEALRFGQIGRFIATDQDAQSLAVIRQRQEVCTKSRIHTQTTSVRDLILKRHDLGHFDFIYAAGLYDYLVPKAAARLTSRLFHLLKAGGHLLVANFLHGIWESPYMETCMDWQLIYRTRQDIMKFSEEIDAADLVTTDYFEDCLRCVGSLELIRQ